MASQSLNSVILSQSMAIKIFGNAESAIGKHVTLMRRLNTSPESTFCITEYFNGHRLAQDNGVKRLTCHFPMSCYHFRSEDFMQNIDMLTVNDSEGLLQSPKRHNMTGANTYVLLSPQTTCTDKEMEEVDQPYQ